MSNAQVADEALRIFSELDLDKSGKIEYPEWQIVTIDRKNLLTEKNIKAAFNFFDSDRNGVISCEEIEKVVGKASDQAVWKEIIKSVDLDGSGEINY